MNNAPTTRETADHAGLLAKLANDMRKFEHHAGGSLRIDMDEVRKVIAACDSHAALLSEIAALRGEVEREKAETFEVWKIANHRATQAERQRDEARAVLIDIRDVPYTEQEWPRSRALNFLANQGADQ